MAKGKKEYKGLSQVYTACDVPRTWQRLAPGVFTETLLNLTFVLQTAGTEASGPSQEEVRSETGSARPHTLHSRKFMKEGMKRQPPDTTLLPALSQDGWQEYG